MNSAVNLSFQTTLLILLRLLFNRDTANETAEFCCQRGNILQIYWFSQGCEGS